MNKLPAIANNESELLKRENPVRNYIVVSLALAITVVGLVVMRLAVRWWSTSDYAGSLAKDAVFTVGIQVLINLVAVFCLYKFTLKKSTKEVLRFSGCKNIKPYFYVIFLAASFSLYFCTITVSSLWSVLLTSFGYVYGSSTPLPDEFNAGYLIAEILLTAVLPAICEEFVCRGGFITTIRKSFSLPVTCVIGGVVFGLFHQNITQVFYTACMGALITFLFCKFNSIIPGILLHFGNNFFSVYFSYADKYGFWGANLLGNNAGQMAAIFIIMWVVTVGLIVLALCLRSRNVDLKKIEIIKNSAFDQTNKRLVLFGELDREQVIELNLEKEVYGDIKEEVYKPNLRANAILISISVIAVITTAVSFFAGYFV